MTKPKPTEKESGRQPASPVLAEIELSRIESFESDNWRVRATPPTDEELADLMSSIKAVGQITPIRVRPHPTKEGRYQRADGAMRSLAFGRLGYKRILAVVEPLTDRQMKILSLQANTFVRLRDSDKEAAVYRLWESEYKSEEEGRPGVRKDAEHVGLREMERDTGMSRETIRGYLQAYEARHKIIQEAPRELREAAKEVSSKDMAAIAPVAKESAKVAQQIVAARTDDDAPLRSKDVQEIAKTFKEATPTERAKVVEKLITAKREEARAIQEARDATKERVAEIKAETVSPEEREKRAQRAQGDREEEARREEAEAKRRADITRERLDGQQLQDFINLDTASRNWEQRTEANANEDLFRRIANVRNQNVKRETIARVRSIAERMQRVASKWAEFVARFKEE